MGRGTREARKRFSAFVDLLNNLGREQVPLSGGSRRPRVTPRTAAQPTPTRNEPTALVSCGGAVRADSAANDQLPALRHVAEGGLPALRKYRFAVIGLAACACCLVIIVVAGAGAAAATHGRRHRHRAEDARLSLAMLQLQSQMQAQASAQRGGTEIVSVAAHHQDDLCPAALGFDQAKADACTREGGVCVADMADCAGSESGGVIKGTCGPSCG